MHINWYKTDEGIACGEFADAANAWCSVQESPTAGHIWLGLSRVAFQRFRFGQGWTVVHRGDTRMHLSQSMLRELLPALQHFAETGALPPHS